jgi:hypothetical protein
MSSPSSVSKDKPSKKPAGSRNEAELYFTLVPEDRGHMFL